MKLNNIDNIKIINLEHINTKESSMLIFNKIENYMKVKRVFFVNPKSKDVITSYDNNGWTARMFDIKKDSDLWHCVYSDTDRYSIGFRIFA